VIQNPSRQQVIFYRGQTCRRFRVLRAHVVELAVSMANKRSWHDLAGA
jgi:hypothetical protein